MADRPAIRKRPGDRRMNRKSPGAPTLFMVSLRKFTGSAASALVVEAVRLVAATAEGPAAYTPVFIHGPQGAGKSRLLGALAREMDRKSVPFVRIDGSTLKDAPKSLVADLAKDLRKGPHRDHRRPPGAGRMRRPGRGLVRDFADGGPQAPCRHRL